jgi:hypothetical protein
VTHEGIEDFRIFAVICCVWGKDTSIGRHISNTQTIWQLSAGDEKSIPALEIEILWHIADSIPFLARTRFFSPITRPKIPAQHSKLRMKSGKLFTGTGLLGKYFRSGTGPDTIKHSCTIILHSDSNKKMKKLTKVYLPVILDIEIPSGRLSLSRSTFPATPNNA